MFLALLALGIAVQPRKPAVQTRFSKKIILPKDYKNSFGCDMCTKVVQYIEQLLKDQTVESEIATLVERLCTTFGSPYDSLCKTVIDSYLPTILEWLEKDLEALDICTKIGLCSTTASLRKISLPKNYKESVGCTMCTYVVNYIEKLLKDQTVEEEIATLVGQLCTTFGSPYDSLCKTVVAQYLPSVLQWLEQDLESLDICTRIGLCSSTVSKRNFVKKVTLPKDYQNGIGCDMCTKVVQYIEQLLKDQTVESEIATLVERLCTTFGSPYDSLCKTVIDSYLPTILEWLEKDLEALDICTKIGLCSSTASLRKISLPKNYQNGIGCDMCTKVVQYIEQLLKDQTVESEIATLVERLCTTFPSPFDSLCKTVIDSYLPTILEWLEKDLEALDICTKIGLCSSTASLRKISLPKNYQNGIGCDMCTKVVQYIEQLLKDQTVESEIATLVERLCTTFGSPYDSLCKTVIDSYLPTILEWLEKDLEALDICTKIGLCSSTASLRKISLPKNYQNGIGCDMCTKVVQYIEQLLKDQTVESEIATLVERLCTTFGSPYDSLCKTVIDSYLPTILEWLEKDLEALDICTKIGLCSTTASLRKISLPKNYKESVGCTMCTYVVNYIEKLLKDQTVEEEIATLVGQLCTTFGSPYDSLCKTVVAQYLPSVPQWLEQDLESLDICTRIGLCSSTVSKRNYVKKVTLPKNYQNGIGCDMCTKVVQYIEQLLKDQTVESEIATLVERLCTTFGSPYDSLCKTVIDSYLPTILEWLEEDLEALDICTKIGLCSTTASLRKISLPKNCQNGIGCDMCTKVVQYIEQLLKDQTVESEIATLVERLCTTFGSPYDSLCKTVIDSYLPTILEWLEKDLEALDICTKIGLCSTTSSLRKISLPKNYKESVGCTMCTYVVNYIEKLLKDQTVEEEIATLVGQLCTTFGSPYDSLCKTVVAQYLPSVLQWLEQDLESLDICTRIGLCSSTVSKRNYVKKVTLPKNYQNGIGCDMCTKVVQYIEQLLKDQTVESEIATLVERLCTTFGSPYDSLCKTVIDSYLPTILEWLEKDLEALDICTKIGLCSTTASLRKISLPKNYQNGIGCDMCTKVVQYIEQLLKDQTVESEIATLVERLCTTFGSPYDSLCKTVIDSYLPTILEWLEKDLEALDICTKIGLCSSTASLRKISLPKNYKESVGCTMCTYVVNYIEKLLKDQTVEEEIATLVGQLCTTFGSPYDSLCKTVVAQYLPSVLQWLEQDLESLDICTRIGLCSSTVSKRNYVKKVTLPKNYQNGIGCDMCTKVVQYIEQLLKDQTVESEIATLVERLCTTFGSPYDSLCKTVIDSYLPTILEWLEKDLEALDICTKIGLCTSQNLRVSKHKSNSSCDVCKSWFQWAEDNLQNVTVDALWKLVSEECPKVPYLKYFCQTINEQNIEAFVSLILSNLPPEQCCSWIKLC